jgi:hypothetical protein
MRAVSVRRQSAISYAEMSDWDCCHPRRGVSNRLSRKRVSSSLVQPSLRLAKLPAHKANTNLIWQVESAVASVPEGSRSFSDMSLKTGLEGWCRRVGPLNLARDGGTVPNFGGRR